MAVITIVPESREKWLELRAGFINSTESSALFGLSPYATAYELWHQKKDRVVVELEPTDRMKWGTRLQDAIAMGIAEDQGWKVRKMNEYLHSDVVRMGSSFDFIIANPKGDTYDEENALLEIKNLDSLVLKEQWVIDEDGNFEAPPHIEIQVQHQMLLARVKLAYIGVLVGGNRIVLIKREAQRDMQKMIVQRITEFWKSIDAGTPPKPDFARDAEFIAKMYGFAEPGKIYDARDDDEFGALVLRYKEASMKAKAAEEAKKALKAQMLMTIGDAEKVLHHFGSITCGVVAEADVSYHREGYRMFTPHWKKEQKAA
jgi:putative phage-type endonuclease